MATQQRCSAAAEPDALLTRAKKTFSCQVRNCSHPISQRTAYYRRYHICGYHAALPEFVLDGHIVRFCQQCGRFQALEEFDGKKKTCRRKLEMHNAQRKRKRALKHSSRSIIRVAKDKAYTIRRSAESQDRTNTPPPSPSPEDHPFSALSDAKSVDVPTKTAVDAVLLASVPRPMATAGAPAPPEDIANIFDEVDLDDLLFNMQYNRNCGQANPNMVYQAPSKAANQVPAAHFCHVNNHLPLGVALPQHLPLAVQPIYSTAMPGILQPLWPAGPATYWAPQLPQRMVQHQGICNTGYPLFSAPTYNFLLDSA